MEAAKKGIHVIVLPFHGQGHMNTMLQLAKRMAWKGVEITLATTLAVTQKMESKVGAMKSITLESIYDDAEEMKIPFRQRMEIYQAQVTENLDKLLIQKLESTSKSKTLLVYDANLPWAIEVAKKHGVRCAAFFTQACASVACYHGLQLVSQGKDPAVEMPPCSVLPSPFLLQKNVPNSFGADVPYTKEGIHPLVIWILAQFSTLDQADYVLFNSFDKLEDPVVKWLSNLWPVKTIGPTIPSVYLDKRVEYDVNYGFNKFKPDDESCINWLNTKPAGSVVYISFGSVADLSLKQTAELAEALKQLPSSFLWVVRETEKAKLPSNFISETSDKGLVLSWCPQLDVLAHEAVGCFVSHCGWNSTIEALSFGVPILAMPQFLDQLVDAHFVEHVWGVGLIPTTNGEGLITREEINRCLVDIMHGERSEKIKENAAMWKSLAKESVDEGGSSDKHIDEIIEQLASS